MQAGVAEADAVILRMPLQTLADGDTDAQVILQAWNAVKHLSRSPKCGGLDLDSSLQMLLLCLGLIMMTAKAPAAALTIHD